MFCAIEQSYLLPQTLNLSLRFLVGRFTFALAGWEEVGKVEVHPFCNSTPGQLRNVALLKCARGLLACVQ